MMQECKLLSFLNGIGLEFNSESSDWHVRVTSNDSSTLKYSISQIQGSELSDLMQSFANYANDFEGLSSQMFYSFLKSLIGVKTDKSIIRIFLECQNFQTEIISLLLDKVQEISHYPDNSASISNLILSQLKWLDNITDKNNLSDKIIECLQTCGLDTKADIINLLPEILGDMHLESLLDELLSLLDSEETLVPPILDALSNLSISDVQINSVHMKVLDNLSSVNPRTLPIILRFLTQSRDKAVLLQLVRVLRKNLDLSTLTSEEFHDGEILFVDSLKSSLRLNKDFVKVYIENISESKAVIQNTIDIYMAILIYTISHGYRPKIESLYKKKMASNLVKKKILKHAIRNHLNSFIDHMHDIISICRCLLDSSSESLISFGQLMYIEIFLSVKDIYYKQEILSSVLSHIGSSSFSTANGALDILQTLVANNSNATRPLSNSIQSIIDFLDNESLSYSHVKKIYKILVMLAYPPIGKPNDSASRDLCILLSKQLSHQDTRYNSIGSYGVSAFIQRLGQAGAESVDMQFVKEIITRSMNNKSAEVLSLLFDEISLSIQSSNPGTYAIGLILEIVNEKFMEFLIPAKEAAELTSKESLWMDLNMNEADDAPSLNIFGLATSLASKERESVLYLIPAFRLLYICMNIINNSLADIDALLGCPVYMFEQFHDEVYDSMTNRQKEEYCNILIIAINWFVEVINAFSKDESEVKDVTRKVLLRLGHLYELLVLLDKYLSKTGNKSSANKSMLGSLSRVSSKIRKIDPCVLKFIVLQDEKSIGIGPYYLLLKDLSSKLELIIGSKDKRSYSEDTKLKDVIGTNLKKYIGRVFDFINAHIDSDPTDMEIACIVASLEILLTLMSSDDILGEVSGIDVNSILSSISQSQNGAASLFDTLERLQTSTKVFEVSVLSSKISHFIIAKRQHFKLPQSYSGQRLADTLINSLKSDWSIYDNQNKRFTEMSYNDGISHIIEKSIYHTNDPIGILYYFSTEILPAYKDGTPFLTLTEDTLSQFLTVFMQATTRLFEDISLTTEEDSFVEVKGLLEVQYNLIQAVWQTKDKALFSAVLNNAKAFIGSFAKKCDWMSMNLKHHKELVLEILKEYQMYGKLLRDIMDLLKNVQEKFLSRSIAPLKKLMESVIFKVEQIMKENSMISSFLIGTLHYEDNSDDAHENENDSGDETESSSESEHEMSNRTFEESASKRSKRDELIGDDTTDLFGHLEDIDESANLYDTIL